VVAGPRLSSPAEGAGNKEAPLPMSLLVSLTALIIAGCAAWLARRGLQPPPDEAALVRDYRLSDYEIAYLEGGPERASAAAVASLAFRGLIEIREDEHELRLADEVPGMAPEVERAVAKEIGTHFRDMKFLGDGFVRAGELLRPRLVELGLVVSAARESDIRWAGVVAFAGVVAAVVGAGVWAGAAPSWGVLPVAFMALLSVSALRPRRTRLGDAIAARFRVDANKREIALRGAFAQATPDDVAAVVALKGPKALANTPLAGLDKVFAKQSSGGGCGCGCGGCGGCGGGCA
jgi:uncharacterized protein (TIGR04222 family)